ncbi:MAG: hypothetical protein Q9165_008066 [Trypethelium subeluteriae]
MRLTDRIETVSDDPEEAADPGNIFHDALGSIFSDTRDQHGHPRATILYKSEKYGTLRLKVETPDQEQDWRLFAHYLWNAGVKMATLVGGEDEKYKEEGKIPGMQNIKGWPWNIAGERVLELGSGAELMMS